MVGVLQVCCTVFAARVLQCVAVMCAATCCTCCSALQIIAVGVCLREFAQFTQIWFVKVCAHVAVSVCPCVCECACV